jgi:hypothetical protein
LRRLGVRHFERSDLRGDRGRQNTVAGFQLAFEEPLAAEPPIVDNRGAVETESDSLEPQHVFTMKQGKRGRRSR